MPQVTAHVLHLMDLTFHAPLRTALMSLLESLCTNTTNGRAAVAAGAAEVLVSAVALSHEAAHRVLSASSSGGGAAAAAAVAAGAPALTTGAHKEPAKEWYFEFDETKDGETKRVRVGPYRKEELQRMLQRGEIGLHTRCFAQGMLRSLPMNEIREMRWMCATIATGSMIIEPNTVALPEVTITVMIAITMATMGRRTKNSAMVRCYAPSPVSGWLVKGCGSTVMPARTF